MDKTTFKSGAIVAPDFLNELQDTVLSEIQTRIQANTTLSADLTSEIGHRNALSDRLTVTAATLAEADTTETQRALAAEAVAGTTCIVLDVKDAVSNAMTADLSAAKGHVCVIVLDSTGINTTAATTQTLTVTGVLSAGHRVNVVNRCGGSLLVAGGSMDRGIADSGLIPPLGQACLTSDGAKYYLDSIDAAVTDLRTFLSSVKREEMIATAPQGDVVIPNGAAALIGQLHLPAGKWVVSGVATIQVSPNSGDAGSGASIFIWLTDNTTDTTSPGGNPVDSIYFGSGITYIGRTCPIVPREFTLTSPGYVYSSAYHSGGGSNSSFFLRSVILEARPQL